MLRTFKQKLLFLFLNSLGYFFLYLPHFLRLNFAKGIAFILYILDSKRKFDLLNNLDFAYNNSLPKEKKQEILKTNYLNLVYNSIHFFMLAVSSKKRVLDNINIDKPEIITKLLQNKEKIIFVTAHFGNWEYTTPAFTCTFNHTITAVARMTPSALVNSYLTKIRERFDITILDKKGAMSGLIRALKQIGIIGIVTDQNTADNEGLLVKFFGKNVRHTPIASLLALKYDAKIVHFIAEYSKDYKKINIKIFPPLEFKKTDNLQDDIQELTQMQSNILEQIIKENPKEWLWFHKKFKNQYPEIYKY
ncbi:lipid A biosynthesis lauroyl acyltransferase [Helicobacter winghamensis]|uniref:Lipid A biosynthesis acyltransferase n=1 Tax=Helicobacter winghamensis TaxID=157268 RepID=A0A2N3PIR6_9HELI|nr:lipid A biosynthesis lauroyl acyltransferase [Helicobacter winghamensis]PKT76274.1 lipid A biosynthesis acyltransferase [Helicobacter winghamensis]PKT76405.1 lipid A biosynthesis acyltransferase [Helicobacter winghamensis]PKT76536.1 lipid A biosynthesis acyltransferase [Helicobacter winghamensis]PKT80785.1 lipid A biosynthesis acyltransferase [Helicobacter winghamensis]PKT81200.1 lipid A biosynthesis acyltransferase [Helicobacter winghamensis]